MGKVPLERLVRLEFLVLQVSQVSLVWKGSLAEESWR